MKNPAAPRLHLIFTTVGVFAATPLLLFFWPIACYHALSSSWVFLMLCVFFLCQQGLKPCLRFPKKNGFYYFISIITCQFALLLLLNTLFGIIFDYVPPPSTTTASILSSPWQAQQHLLIHAGLFPWSLYLLFTLIYLRHYDPSKQKNRTMKNYLQQSAFKRLLDAYPNAITIVALIASVALLLSLFSAQAASWFGLWLNNPPYQTLYLCTPFVFAILFALMGSHYMERRLVTQLSHYISSLGFLFLCYSVVFSVITALLFKGIALLGGPLMITLPRTLNHFQRDSLLHGTTVFCWALQLAIAPFVGTVFARLSRDRSMWTVTASLLVLPFGLSLALIIWPHGLETSILSAWHTLEGHQQMTLKLASVLLSLIIIIAALTPIQTSKHLIHGWLPEIPAPKRPLHYQRLLKILLMSTVSCMALLSLGGVFALEYLTFAIALPNLVLLGLYLWESCQEVRSIG